MRRYRLSGRDSLIALLLVGSSQSAAATPLLVSFNRVLDDINSPDADYAAAFAQLHEAALWMLTLDVVAEEVLDLESRLLHGYLVTPRTCKILELFCTCSRGILGDLRVPEQRGRFPRPRK